MNDSPPSPRITQWQVITGAPCAGKTAVINLLNQRGYQIVPEVARAFIDEQIAGGLDLPQIKADILAFERNILLRKVAVEDNLRPDAQIFLDRAVPDSIAYYQMEGLDPAEAVRRSRATRYKKIFLLDRLPFQADAVRSETDDLARRIEALLCQCYTELGYGVIRVPVMGIAERTEFILSHAPAR